MLHSILALGPRRSSRGTCASALFLMALAISLPSRAETKSVSPPTATGSERSKLGGTVAAAGTTRHLFGIPVLALDLSGGISLLTPKGVSVDGVASYLLGRTEAG